ncbi:hypothetical protein ACWNT8_05770 [Pigmentibacter ruber]|nr:hypothetical protein GTC16762_28500 [Pigmentibacter ruber]
MRIKKVFAKFIIFIFLFSIFPSLHAKKLYLNRKNNIVIEDTSKPFNSYTWLVAHNAYSNDNIFSNQYGLPVTELLKYGARGLMLDLYDYDNSIYLCHKSCYFSNYGKFFETMSYSVLPFLRNNPRDVITIFLEDHSSREMLEQELAKIQGLEEFLFNPSIWAEYKQWPSLEEMIQKNQRLIIITDNKKNSGYYEINGKEIHLVFGPDLTVENYWSLGDTYLSHNYTCVSRWPEIPLSTKKSSYFYNQWDRLVVMNQFHGIPFYPHSLTDNKFKALFTREQKNCHPETERMPNYVAVDNVTSGDAKEYVQWLNSGGILFYKDIIFDTDNFICGFAIIESGSSDLSKFRCDQAIRAIKINRLKEGTIIRIYDKSYKFLNFEYVELTMKKDMLDAEEFKIDLENYNFENSYYKYIYYGKKLDKKTFQKIEVIVP